MQLRELCTSRAPSQRSMRSCGGPSRPAVSNCKRYARNMCLSEDLWQASCQIWMIPASKRQAEHMQRARYGTGNTLQRAGVINNMASGTLTASTATCRHGIINSFHLGSASIRWRRFKIASERRTDTPTFWYASQVLMMWPCGLRAATAGGADWNVSLRINAAWTPAKSFRCWSLKRFLATDLRAPGGSKADLGMPDPYHLGISEIRADACNGCASRQCLKSERRRSEAQSIEGVSSVPTQCDAPSRRRV